MQTKKQRILVTGGAGYVGSVLVHLLIENDDSVRVIDNMRWGGESLLGLYHHPRFELLKGDIRNPADVNKSLEGIDAVVHLAAIVGDPACRKEPALATETNDAASIGLFRAAEKHGVRRFIFASTCSNYGKMPDPSKSCDETSELRPVSLYAELKVKFEKYILESRSDMCSVALRFSTAYGLSPRMRFDLTVNEFTRDAALKNELVIYGEQFWRPYCHTQDLARACLLMLQLEKEKVDRQAFNVGENGENYQKQMLLEETKKQIPTVTAQFVRTNEDPRDYKVDFTKIHRLGFSLTKRVPDGIREIRDVLEKKVILNPYDKKYGNT